MLDLEIVKRRYLKRKINLLNNYVLPLNKL